MPTGYTCDLKEDTRFPDFAMRCARAMGALVMMRDDPFDAPIPNEFQPSDHYRKALENAKSKQVAAHQMTLDQAAAAIVEFNKHQEKRRGELKAEDGGKRRAYERMIGLVQDWQPPTDDHVNFKKFMLDQLRESLKFDCHEHKADEFYAAFTGTPAEWRDSEIQKAAHDVAYYEKAWQEEQDRTASRNKWLRDLRQSLAGK